MWTAIWQFSRCSCSLSLFYSLCKWGCYVVEWKQEILQSFILTDMKSIHRDMKWSSYPLHLLQLCCTGSETPYRNIYIYTSIYSYNCKYIPLIYLFKAFSFSVSSSYAGTSVYISEKIQQPCLHHAVVKDRSHFTDFYLLVRDRL